MNRKDILLRAAYDLLMRAKQAHFVEDALELHAHYDQADCDGACLMEDIACELDIPEGTNPIPLTETIEVNRRR